MQSVLVGGVPVLLAVCMIHETVNEYEWLNALLHQPQIELQLGSAILSAARTGGGMADDLHAVNNPAPTVRTSSKTYASSQQNSPACKSMSFFICATHPPTGQLLLIM